MLLKKTKRIPIRIASFALSSIMLFVSIQIKPSAAGKIADLSPALSVLASQLSLVKSGITGNSIEFTAEDFDDIIGIKVPSVTFISLPEKSCGRLMFGNRELEIGETVYRKELSEIQFVPTEKITTEASFKIGIVGNQAYDCPCSLYVISDLNFAPSADTSVFSSSEITAFSGVPYYGSVLAVDPEGDPLTYTVTEYPSDGVLIASSDGSYSYTPYENHVGRDSFSFVSRDRYGNTTNPIEVSVNVKEAKESIIFTDMSENEAIGSAMTVTDAGIMNGRESNGQYYFDPASTVSRAEYLSMLYAAAGIKPDPSESENVFFDTDELSSELQACLSHAYKKGYVKGETTSVGIYFRPDDMITRSDAAEITAAVLELDIPASLPAATFSDIEMISPEAYESIVTLCSAGIFRTVGGEFAPNAALTRAHAAQVLEGVLRYCG